MDIKILRQLIDETLLAMEAGEFQVFCEEFLPLYNETYTGITRNGHNMYGKTRPGVPDLLLEKYHNHQIACECGTEEDYWKKPKDDNDLNKMKPIQDSLKCINELNHLQEIIIVSNRETPASQPNIKNDIIQYIKSIIAQSPEKQIKCKITVLAGQNISRALINNVQNTAYTNIFQTFFSAVHSIILLEQETVELKKSKHLSSQLKTLASLINSFNADKHTDNLTSININKTNYYINNYTFEPEKTNIIKRIKHNETSILSNPHGKIIQIIGAPKIGKTFLCYQHVNVHAPTWLIPPLEFSDRNSTDFLNHVLKVILEPICMQDGLIGLNANKIDSELIASNLKSELGNQVVIINKADRLKQPFFDLLSDVLSTLKKTGVHKKLSVILISNKDLKSNLFITNTIVSPKWSEEEIATLLSSRNIETERSSAYFKLLTSRCCGHPLAAIYLAEQNPTLDKLLHSFFDGSKILDDELAWEINNLLYEKTLQNTDERNFIHRLSVLPFPVHSKEIEAIRFSIKPPINEPPQLLIDKIGMSIITGNIEAGIELDTTFKAVVFNKVSKEEKNKILLAVGNELFKPHNKTIDAHDAIKSINYTLFAGKISLAICRAFFFAYSIREAKSGDQSILEELYFLESINKPKDLFAQLILSHLYIILAEYYASTGNKKKAYKLLSRFNIKSDEVSKHADNEMRRVGRDIMLIVIQLRLSLIEFDVNPVLTINNYFNIQDVPHEHQFCLSAKEFTEILEKIPIEHFLNLPFNKIFLFLYNKDINCAINFFSSIGYKLSILDTKDERVINVLKQCEDCRLSLLVQSSICFHKKIYDEALKCIGYFETDCLTSRKNNYLTSSYYAFKGDLLSGSNNVSESVSAYKISLEKAEGTNTFTQAWCNFKIGILSNAIDHLKAAEQVFKKRKLLDYSARCLAAQSAILLSEKNYTQGLLIAEELFKSYFIKNNNELKVSVRVLVAQLSGLKIKLDRKPNIKKIHYPELGAQVYNQTYIDNLNEISATVAYYILYEVYNHTNNKAKKLSLLHNALNLKPNMMEEYETSYPLVFHLYYLNLFTTDKIEISSLPIHFSNLLLCYQNKDKNRKYLLVWEAIWPFVVFFQSSSEKNMEVVEQILNIFEDTISHSKVNLIEPWQLGLSYLKGTKLLFVDKNDKDAYPYFIHIYTSSLGKINWLACYSGMILSINLTHYISGLYLLAKISFNTFKILDNSNDLNNIANFTMQLYNKLITVNARRLVGKDISVSAKLLRPIKTITKLPIEQSIKVNLLILLLCGVFNYESDRTNNIYLAVIDVIPLLPDNVRDILYNNKILI